MYIYFYLFHIYISIYLCLLQTGRTLYSPTLFGLFEMQRMDDFKIKDVCVYVHACIYIYV